MKRIVQDAPAFRPAMFFANLYRDTMTLSQPGNDELAALRELERAVRACGLPTMMVAGQKQFDMLTAALKAVADARSAQACMPDQGV